MGQSSDASRPRDQLPSSGGSFEEESTVSISPAFHEEDPTEPVALGEGALEEPSEATARRAAAPSPDTLQRVMAEVDRLKALAGSRGARLTPEIEGAIRVALAQPGPTRLTPEMAISAASSLLALTDDQYAHAAEMLRRAGEDSAGRPAAGADRDAEQALILRAVAERRSKLATGVLAQVIRRLGIPVTSDRHLKEIASFAEEIRGRKGRG